MSSPESDFEYKEIYEEKRSFKPPKIWALKIVKIPGVKHKKHETRKAVEKDTKLFSDIVRKPETIGKTKPEAPLPVTNELSTTGFCKTGDDLMQ